MFTLKSCSSNESKMDELIGWLDWFWRLWSQNGIPKSLWKSKSEPLIREYPKSFQGFLFISNSLLLIGFFNSSLDLSRLNGILCQHKWMNSHSHKKARFLLVIELVAIRIEQIFDFFIGTNPFPCCVLSLKCWRSYSPWSGIPSRGSVLSLFNKERYKTYGSRYFNGPERDNRREFLFSFWNDLHFSDLMHPLGKPI